MGKLNCLVLCAFLGSLSPILADDVQTAHWLGFYGCFKRPTPWSERSYPWFRSNQKILGDKMAMLSNLTDDERTRLSIAFNVAPDGSMHSLRSVESCGQTTLDCDIIESLKAAGPLQPPPKSVVYKQLRLHIADSRVVLGFLN